MRTITVGRIKDEQDKVFIGVPKDASEPVVELLSGEGLTIITFDQKHLPWLIEALEKELE